MGTDTSKSLFDQALKEIMATNYVAAELLLQQASEINEEGTTLYAASWAILLALRDRTDEAIEILEERLADFSTDPNLLLAYGIALEKQEKYVDAEDAFRESLVNDPDSAGALRGLSACLERKGDLIGGCRMAAKAFSLAPDNLVLAKSAANLLEKAGQRQTAHEVLELGAHYNPEDEELVTRAVESCLRKGEEDRAWEILLLVDESQPWAAGWKANFLDWRGSADHANSIIQKTLERHAVSDNDFLFHLCCILMRRGQVAAAEAYVDHILGLDPQHAGALRMRADFSLGRFDYNPLIDPIGAAAAVAADAPSWARFWSHLNDQQVSEAEEVLEAMSEDETFAGDPLEAARLELAEQLFLALASGETAETELHALSDLPSEAACGVLLEFLEVLDGRFADKEGLEEYRELLNLELGQRDPVLRLTRFYALGSWDSLREALQEFKQSLPDVLPDEGPDPAMIGRLYTLLHALGTEDDQAVDDFDFDSDPNFAGNVYEVLMQKQNKNPVEQRFMNKLQGEMQKVKVRDVQEPSKTDNSPGLYHVGGVLDHRDLSVVVYETEDGELVENFNESDFEVIEEYEEIEEDPDDPNYEYVWVEEEVEEEPEPQQRDRY